MVFRKERKFFETVKPNVYPLIIRHTWYKIFNPQMGPKEKEKHFSVLQNLLRIYSSTEPAELIRGTTPPERCDQVTEERAQLVRMLKAKRQLIVPVMGGGMVPAAFVYDHLNKRNLVRGVAFLGHTRHDTGLSYYKPGKVYATESDIQILKTTPKNSILVVDDAIDSEITIAAVANFLRGLGIKTFDFVCLRVPSRRIGPAFIKAELTDTSTWHAYPKILSPSRRQ